MLKEVSIGTVFFILTFLILSVWSHGGDHDDDSDDDGDSDGDDGHHDDDDGEHLKDAEKFLEPDPGQEFKSAEIEGHHRALPFVGPWMKYNFNPCAYDKAEGHECSKYDGPRKYWFYDKSKDSCELFIFRGCDGNANRFKYKSYCEMCLSCRQERRYQDCNKKP